MADEKKPEAAAPGGSRKKTIVTIAIIVLVMALEGGAVFLATRWASGGPQMAAAMNGADEALPAKDDVEIVIADFMAPNAKTGRVFVYEIQVAARVAKDDQERLQAMIEEQRLSIDDRLNNIVRAAPPQVLSEDGLETLKRQMRFEINKILKDEELIDAVLIPKMMPHRADF